MYRPQRRFKQSVPYLVVGVQTSCLDQYNSCSVDSVHIKFQGCTVDVQRATELLAIITLPCCMCTNYSLEPVHFMRVGNVHIKFQGCTVEVQATTEF